jgi:membrane dipeptidase
VTTRAKVAVAAGAAVGGALAVARPALDLAVARVEDRLCGVYPDPRMPVGERAAALHATLRVADLHADSLLFGRDLLKRGEYAHADVPRWIEGRVALQVMAMAVKTPSGLNIESNRDDSDDVLKVVLAKRWPTAAWRRMLPRVQYLVAQAERLEAGSGGRFRVVRTRADLAAYLAAHAADAAMIAGLLAIEGAHALDDDPANLEAVAELGVRMISMAHFFDTVFGGSAHGIGKGGLTLLGRELLAGMEARGILLDVAHSSPATVDDALTVATRPVVASHTGVRGIVDNQRNLSDAQLEGIAATGGLVGIGFWETATGGRDAAAIARSIAYTVERIGARHVSLGSDWDGAVSVPFDAASTVRLTQALVDVGLDDDAIRAVMGENILRLLSETLPEG